MITDDSLGPVINNISSTILGYTSAVITWTTEEDSTSVVDYGTSKPPTQTSSNLSFVLSHSITLNNLTRGTTYYFRVSSADIYGNSSTNDNSGNFYAFTMPSDNFLPPISNQQGGGTTQTLEIDEDNILLNNNNPFTKENNIDVQFNLEETLKFRIGDEKNLDSQSWQPFKKELIKDILGGDGKKSIYFQFQNSEGLMSPVIEKTIVLDTTPPSAPFNLRGEYIDNYIKISFKKSSDSDIAGTRVFKSLDAFILNPFSGEEIISDGKSETIFDNKIAANKKYYYSVFNYDYARNYSSPALVIVNTFIEKPSIEIISDKGVKVFSYNWLKQNLNIEIGSKLEDLTLSQKTLHYLEKTPISITIEKNIFLQNNKLLLLRVGDGYFYGLQETDSGWSAKIDTPSNENNVLVALEIISNDGSKEVIELGQILIDPFGYVYQDVIEPHLRIFKDGLWSWEKIHTQNKLEKVKVFLYQYSNDIKDWSLFDATRFGQKNPQITSKDGYFGFLVPNGNYYLEAIKIGFGEKATEQFKINDGIINKNIELSSITINWWFVAENRIVILFLIIPIVLIFGIIIIRIIKKYKNKKQNVIYNGFSVK